MNFNHRLICNYVTALGIFLTPMVVGIVGYFFTSSDSKQNLDKEYVSLAVSVLGSKDPQTSDLRPWAVEILKKFSPAKMSSELIYSLQNNSANFPTTSSDLVPYVRAVYLQHKNGTPVHKEAVTKLCEVLRKDPLTDSQKKAVNYLEKSAIGVIENDQEFIDFLYGLLAGEEAAKEKLSEKEVNSLIEQKFGILKQQNTRLFP